MWDHITNLRSHDTGLSLHDVRPLYMPVCIDVQLHMPMFNVLQKIKVINLTLLRHGKIYHEILKWSFLLLNILLMLKFISMVVVVISLTCNKILMTLSIFENVTQIFTKLLNNHILIKFSVTFSTTGIYLSTIDTALSDKLRNVICQIWLLS